MAALTWLPAPPACAANLLLHLDAGSLALADGAPLAAWGGLSQGDPSRRPTYQASNPAFNGLATVNFDGLDNPNGDFLSGLAINNTQTVLAVTRLRAGSGSLDTLWSAGNDSNNIRRNDSTTFYRSPGRGQNSGDYPNGGGHLAVNAVGSGAFALGQAHLMLTQSAGQRSYSNLHLGTATSGGGGAANRYWTGDVAEILVFDGPLSRGDRWAIESGLSQKYSLGYQPDLFARIPLIEGDLIAGTPAGNANEILPNLFDAAPNTKYLTTTPTPTFTYTFAPGLLPIAHSYSFTSANDTPGRDPRDWRLEGSLDGLLWDLIDQRAGVTFASRFQTQFFDIANPGAYSQYRVTIDANGGQPLFQLADWQLYGVMPEPGRALLLAIGLLALFGRRRVKGTG